MSQNPIKKVQVKPVAAKTEPEKYVSFRSSVTGMYDRGCNRHDIDDIVRGLSSDASILTNLVDFEKKIDALVKRDFRKRYDLQQLFIRPARKVKKILRVHVKNELVQNNHKLKIKGYIFPVVKETKDMKFTAFFKQISLKFSNDNYHGFVWKKAQPNQVEKDGLIINLSSNEKTSVQISFYMLNNPPKFKMDPSLQKIVRMESGTRTNILQAIWQYIKINKLQDSQSKQTINLDENMKNAFKCEKLQFSMINARIRQLLTPADPHLINMTIMADKSQQKIYDFVVEVETRPKIDVMPFLSQRVDEKADKMADTSYFFLNQKIKKIDKAIQDHTQKLRRHIFKRDVYRNFSQETIQKIIVEQNELLRQLTEHQKRDNASKLEFFLENDDEVEKEIRNYLESLGANKPNQ